MKVKEATEAFLDSLKDTYLSGRVNGSADFLQGECRLLSMLCSDHGSKKQPGELAKKLGVTTARVASTLRTLEAKNYVVRETSETDRRKVYVCITDEGREYLEQKREKVCGFFDAAFSKFTEEECDEFIRLIQKLTRSSHSPENSDTKEQQ